MEIFTIELLRHLPKNIKLQSYAGVPVNEAARLYQKRFGCEPKTVYVHRKSIFIPVPDVENP